MRLDEYSTPTPHFLGDFSPGVPSLSVIVPLYNEEGLVSVLCERIARVIDAMPVEAEVILVDDGSDDGTLSAIARIHARDSRFLGVGLSRNFGHQFAITAGLAHARGDAVVIMDGDLQDPPEAIGPLWSKLNEGFDVVYAIRASRPETRLKRFAYWAFYRVLGRLVSIEIPHDAGDFGIMSRRVVDQLNAMPEHRRFVRGLRAWVGYRQIGLPIDRSPRHSGPPKYTLRKLFGLALDGLIGFSETPLRCAAAMGGLVILATLTAMVAAGARVVSGAGWPPGWYCVACLLGLFSGTQLLFLALLGEYISRIFQEVNGRPLYIVQRRIGFAPQSRKPSRRSSSRTRTP